MLLLAFIFVGIFGVSTVVALRFSTNPDAKVQRRLKSIRVVSQDSPKAASIDASAALRVESRLAESAWAAWIPKLLRESRGGWSESNFLACSGAMAIVGGSVGFATSGSFVLTPVAGLALGCLLYVWLRHQRAKRLNAFDQCLPDAIDLMSGALQAGHSMQQMILVTSEQMREPVRGELAQVHQEQNLGVPLREALLTLTERVPSQDLRFVVTAMLIQRKTGGDLIPILERTSHVIRERIRVAGEVRTYTAQGRLTGWVLTALPVLLLGVVFVITPSYADVLFKDPIGQRLLCGGSVMLLIGGLLIRTITKVEV